MKDWLYPGTIITAFQGTTIMTETGAYHVMFLKIIIGIIITITVIVLIATDTIIIIMEMFTEEEPDLYMAPATE